MSELDLSSIDKEEVEIPNAMREAMVRIKMGFRWFTTSTLLASVFYALIEPTAYSICLATGFALTETTNVIINNNRFPTSDNEFVLRRRGVNWWPHNIQGLGYLGGFFMMHFARKLKKYSADTQSGSRVATNLGNVNSRKVNYGLVAWSLGTLVLLLLAFLLNGIFSNEQKTHTIAFAFTIGIVTGILFGALSNHFTQVPPFNATVTTNGKQRHTCSAYLDGVMVGRVH